MNKLTLTNGEYNIVNAIPDSYTLVYHTPENKAIVAVVWSGLNRFFVRHYTKGIRNRLSLISDHTCINEEEAIALAKKLARV